MVSPALRAYIQRIETATYHEEKLVLTVRGFIDLFPFMGAVLYNYSMLSHMGEGLLRANAQGLYSVRDQREDIRNMPPIYSAIREKRAVLLDSDLIRQIPAKYVHGTTYALIVPIFHGSNVIGYAGISGHPDGCDGINRSLIDALSQYGEQVGKALATEFSLSKAIKLTKREVEVLQRMSWGESIKEMADHIGISEFTVQDYVKSALKKLGAQNRTQGVADALRRRIIS
ncbi:LuxR C-terminal-related transcriptional regulator [Brevibacillus nitrificans]|uniref:helix-turn-helix transcriptional regulator n=1 Tax=Brevibacillus nitrificans TaxID=651560 RepID=UPI002859920C|nr:LuxR C-terminal-related transcriptional regulator [Brevibacillus nitrificans]MDR7317919.1 DNA-binding CsgD family transcriptional regulator [Brevibacillus nitrificans]